MLWTSQGHFWEFCLNSVSWLKRKATNNPVAEGLHARAALCARPWLSALRLSPFPQSRIAVGSSSEGCVLPWPSLSPAAGSSSVGICQAPLQCIHKPLGSSCLSGSIGLFLFPCQDKKYASDKYKDIYTELSIVKAKADCDISRLKEQLKAATEAQGEKSPVNTTVSGYGQSSSSSSKQSWVSRANTGILEYKALCSNGSECRTWPSNPKLMGFESLLAFCIRKTS